ncbi:uncharacterized protein LOC117181899 [Belonocnema kinseyi]|uniref:uncharacterized protein LOC117181899 n=1 Tax=Belonocnema kinseyi TaxID=2817044 RepID=UPI00143DD417|nr:uncharacterized protein LOC117181899 [Belonocnema kinseyi]
MEKCFPYFSLQPAKRKNFPITVQSSPGKIDKQISVCNANVDAAVGSDTNIYLKHQFLGNESKVTEEVSILGTTELCSDYPEFSKETETNFDEKEFNAKSTPLKDEESQESENVKTGKKIDFSSSNVQTDSALCKEKRTCGYPDPFDRMIIQTLELYKRIFIARESFKKLVKSKKDAKMKKKHVYKKQDSSNNDSEQNRNNKDSKDNAEKRRKTDGEKLCLCGKGCASAVLSRCCCKTK